ncbi:hypothetical protein HDV02_001922 [Globomyces sp. JEL0801]|nr:hypothetical protein HDV02_001922 [Globomyces sp. JEL0801]
MSKEIQKESVQIPHVNLQKYNRKIKKVKLQGRSELKISDWTQYNLSKKSSFSHYLWNLNQNLKQIERIDYQSVNETEFIDRFESKNIPVVILGATDDWKAKENWTIKKLAYMYRHERFKIGEDDDGKTVYLGAKYYFHYALKDPYGAIVDDSPLYIFDANFGKRRLHHSSRRTKIEKTSKHRYDPESSQATCHLVDDYKVPKYFRDDLFSLVGSRRPPFRWIVIGPARSGTGIHTDPLGWVLFPPGTAKHIVHPKLSDQEGATWFDQVYPKMMEYTTADKTKTLGEQLKMMEIIQNPGETVFVPSGWWHIVINIDFTIAVTQNFCSKTNLETVWLKARFINGYVLNGRYSRPKMAMKLRSILESNNTELKLKKKRKKINHQSIIDFNSLDTIPTLRNLDFKYLFVAISSSPSTSTTCSSSDSDVDVICECHGKRRRSS